MTSRTLWTFNNQSMATSAPTFTRDNGVVFCARGGTTTCVDAVSGELRWQHTVPAPIECSPMVHTNGTIFVGDYAGTVRVFSSEGHLAWSFELNAPIMTTGCMDRSNNVWVGDDSGWLHQFRPDGQRISRIRLTDLVVTPPISMGDRIFLADESLRCTAGTVTALTEESGVAPMALCPDGSVLVGSWDGGVRKISEGIVQWAVALDGQIYGGCSVDEAGNIFVGTRRGQLVALTPNGERIWSRQFKDGVYGTPALSNDGLCFVGCNDRYLYAMSQHTGDTVWRERCGREIRSSPLLCPDGTVVVSCWDYKTYAFRGDGGGNIARSWSQFQGSPFRQGFLPLL